MMENQKDIRNSQTKNKANKTNKAKKVKSDKQSQKKDWLDYTVEVSDDYHLLNNASFAYTEYTSTLYFDSN